METNRISFYGRDAIPAFLLAVWNVASAPFLTKVIVEPIRNSMEIERFIVVVGGAAVLLGAGVVVGALVHLKHQRWQRLGLIGAGFALVAAFVISGERESAAVEVVEHLHFVTYGSLAVLLIVPLRRLGALLPLGVLSVLLSVALLDEGMQWLVPARTGEFFDIGLNLFAGFCGLLVGAGLFVLVDSPLEPGAARRLRVG